MKKLSETLTELGIAFDFPIEIKNAIGKATYFEDSDGYWEICEYDHNGCLTYFKDSYDYWEKYKRSTNGRLTSFKNSDGVQSIEN
jgi:hypothetical protein